MMTLMMVIFWGVVIWLVVRRRPDSFTGPNETPREILDGRFAKGEIDEQEYQRCLDVMRES